MRVYIKILFCTIFLYNCGICSGVHQCWSCSSEECNDPFSSSAAEQETCSNLSQYSNLRDDTNNKTNNLEKLKYAVWKSYNVSYNNEFVCLKFSAAPKTDSSIKVTYRGCFPLTSNIEVCQLVRQVATQQDLLNIKGCSTCDSDLCNSAIEWKSSLSVAVAAILTLLSFFLH